MGGSAGSGGGGQPMQGGQPSQMPAQAQGMQGRIQGMADKFQGMPSAPGVAQGTQAGPLGQTNMPAHQDWRSQMNAGQQGGMEWLEQLKQMRPQYGQSARAGNFRGGMAAVPLRTLVPFPPLRLDQADPARRLQPPLRWPVHLLAVKAETPPPMPDPLQAKVTQRTLARILSRRCGAAWDDNHHPAHRG